MTSLKPQGSYQTGQVTMVVVNKNLPTGTVTFLFTDIEGSTKLAQDYPDTWEELRKQHDAVLRRAIEAQDGYVFRTIGDAFCAAFQTAVDALQAAVGVQLDFNARNWDGPPIKVRIGINTGNAEIQEDGDYQGYLTLTRAQRVMSAACGGQILLSNTAAELVRNDLPENISLLDVKEHHLKGLPTPERLWQVIARGLPKDFPPLQTLVSVPNNLPVPMTTFIGREKEISAIKQELGSRRLITLTGPGGIGKTRLSLQVAFGIVNNYQHGAWFVELDHVTDPGLVATTITHIFNIHETGGRNSEEALKDYLREKELLLILDNFEQVIKAAILVKELLIVARDLKIIVTSRMPLRVSGEYEYRVPLLPLPVQEKFLSLEQLSQLESVQLFIERAQTAKADFVLTKENGPAIAEICRRLDGLPLAIELAAARVRVLPPQKMLGQLNERLKFLTSSAPDLPVRQQTLRAAISWSCDLLAQPEKLLFRRLAVFSGGATFEAIEEVCNIGDDLDILNEIESLLDKNLIRQIEQDNDIRFEMLETIRDFADDTLVASGEANLIQEQHLLYFHQLATVAELNLVGSNELQWFMRLAEEIDNLRSAVLWGIEHNLEKSIELVYRLSLFWSRGGHNDQVIGWLDLALSNPFLNDQNHKPVNSHKLRAKALLTLGILSTQQGYSRAKSILSECISLLRKLDEKADLAVALAFFGYLGDLEASQESVAISRTIQNKWIQSYCLAWQSQALRLAGGDLQLARRLAEESAELAREIKSPWAVARSAFSQGQIDAEIGALAQARTNFEECFTLFSQSQDKYHANMARTELAHIERRQGNNPVALHLYQAAIFGWNDLGLKPAVARHLECLAMVVATQGYLKEAVHLLGAAMNLREQAGSHLMPGEQIEYDNIFEGVGRQVEEKDIKQWLLKGQEMEMPEAVTYALSLPDTVYDPGLR